MGMLVCGTLCVMSAISFPLSGRPISLYHASSRCENLCKRPVLRRLNDHTAKESGYGDAVPYCGRHQAWHSSRSKYYSILHGMLSTEHLACPYPFQPPGLAPYTKQSAGTRHGSGWYPSSYITAVRVSIRVTLQQNANFFSYFGTYTDARHEPSFLPTSQRRLPFPGLQSCSRFASSRESCSPKRSKVRKQSS